MPSPRNPLPNTGPYTPPRIVGGSRPDTPPADFGPFDLAASQIAAVRGQYQPNLNSLVGLITKLYPEGVPAKTWSIANNLPVADRQTLTMAASQHPLPNTGPYQPPVFVDPERTHVLGAPGQQLEGNVLPRDAGRATPGGWHDLLRVLSELYPEKPVAVDPYATGPHTIANSQAIGDRPVTTMTNPLPGYSPLTMVKGQAAAQLRTLINHALAQRGLSPLINTPLPVGATQMGAR